MHGLGNDFIVIEAMEKEYFPTPNDARRLCNRRTGIGADGLLLALPRAERDTTLYVRRAVSTPYLDMTLATQSLHTSGAW